MLKHFLQFKDLSRDELLYLFERTRLIKIALQALPAVPAAGRPHAGDDFREKLDPHPPVLRGRHAPARRLGDLPEYARFAAGARRAGGRCGEVISRMGDIVMIRTFEQDIIERFAAHSRVPVINGLTNEYHPCQILADIYTYIEHRGSIQGKTVAWIGDSNNMCNTWLQAAEVLDFNVHVSTPPGYEVEPERADLFGTDHLRKLRRPDGCLSRRRPGDHRRVDQHGLRSGKRRTPEGLCRLAGRCRHDARWRNRMRCSCTACPRIAARKSRPT